MSVHRLLQCLLHKPGWTSICLVPNQTLHLLDHRVLRLLIIGYLIYHTISIPTMVKWHIRDGSTSRCYQPEGWADGMGALYTRSSHIQDHLSEVGSAKSIPLYICVLPCLFLRPLSNSILLACQPPPARYQYPFRICDVVG